MSGILLVFVMINKPDTISLKTSTAVIIERFFSAVKREYTTVRLPGVL